MADYPIFGQSDSTVSQPASCGGLSGFWTVPPGFSWETDSSGQIWVTNPDTGHRYAARIDLDGVAKYQDLFATYQLGQS